MDDEILNPTENQEPEQAPQEEEKGSFKLDLYFWTQALTIALVFLVLTFTLVGRVIRVVGSSMVPTLYEGDLMLLQSVGYTPKQGDVVVLRKEAFMSDPVVKRVIATGGQRVVVDYNTHSVVVYDDPEDPATAKVLDEPYIKEQMDDPYKADLSVLDVVVPQGSIYVLGDNRNNSSDSRHVRLSTVDTRYVLGKALFVLAPFGHFGAIK